MQGTISLRERDASLWNESDTNSIKTETKRHSVPAVPETFQWNSWYLFLIMSIGAHTRIMNFSQFMREDQSNNANLFQILIAYIFVAIPISYMQVVLGQYTNVGLFYLMRMVPIGAGISFVCCFSIFVTSIFTITILETFFLYLLLCFEPSDLQWMKCPPLYKDICWEPQKKCEQPPCIKEGIQLSAYIYWNQSFMKGVPPIENASIGVPEICRVSVAFFCWFLIFLVSIVKFNKFNKVVKWMVLIIILLKVILVITLSTHIQNLSRSLYLTFRFNLKHLKSFNAWRESIQIAVKSLILGDFTFIMFGVYTNMSVKSGTLMCFNGFISYILRLIDVLLINSAVSCLLEGAGLNYTNEYLLFRPNTANMAVGVVPSALGIFGANRFWSVVYFIVIFGTNLLRVNITLMLMQKVIFQRFPKTTIYHKYLSPFVCGIGFGIGVMFTSKESHEWLKDSMLLISSFVDHVNVLLLTILVFYVYGINRFCNDVHFMHGMAPSRFWKGTWIVAPILLAISIDTSYLNTNHPMYVTRLIIICIMFIPLIIWSSFTIVTKILKRDFVSLFRPELSWGPMDPEKRELRAAFNPKQETRYAKKVYNCQHKCLLGNKTLAKIIEDEDAAEQEFNLNK